MSLPGAKLLKSLTNRVLLTWVSKDNTVMDEKQIEAIISQVLTQLGASGPVSPPDADSGIIPVELSGRHVHLCQADVDALFDGSLTFAKELSQPGEFLCKERVRLIGARGVIDNVAVLGPVRTQSQVELSLTDAKLLGVKAPVRASGDLDGTPGVVMTAGAEIIGLDSGVIVAARHIHMTPEDAVRFNTKNGDRVCVHMSSQRPAMFEDVVVRVNENFRLAMHIDFDEANGCGWTGNSTGRIVKQPEETPWSIRI